MVIKTEIDWLVEKKLTEEEKEIIDAKKEVLTLFIKNNDKLT